MGIRLRRLQRKDAPMMLEWMHDSDIQACFQKDMMSLRLSDAAAFCENAEIPDKLSEGLSIHYAIADECDEYLGTISLKNIDLRNNSAEYAVVLRRKAQGKGLAYRATYLVLEEAFARYGLHRVYLNVLESNDSAIKLYERVGFTYEGEFRELISKNGKYMNLRWYGMLENEYRHASSMRDMNIGLQEPRIKSGGVILKSIFDCNSICDKQEQKSAALLTFHTQYLAAEQEQTNMHMNEFIYTNIIEAARQTRYK